MKKITLITTGQPTTNPRIVKEAETLKHLGYDVTVIFCFYQDWAIEHDKNIIKKNPNIYICCGGDPVENKISFLKTRIRQKVCSILFRYIKHSPIAENAISRAHREALKLAKSIKSDIYIAHNLGALPAAVIAAKINKGKVGYDAEDMHSGQFTDNSSESYLLNKYIEDKYFKSLSYFTAASPLIAKQYKQTYPYLKPVVINNVFPKTQKPVNQINNTRLPLRLFWFSQTIGTDRGIELIIEAIGLSGREMEFHLWGKCTDDYSDFLFQLSKKSGLNNNQIVIHDPVSPEEIIRIAYGFDVGMASETGITLNREICLTNKIFVYLQCGLAIVSSNTEAQSLFIEDFPKSGLLYKRNEISDLMNCLIKIDDDRKLLAQIKENNYKLGQIKVNWETESLRFIELINSL